MSLIKITRSGAEARIKPDGFLGTERFRDYRMAIEGARYDWREHAYLVNLDPIRVSAILERLKKAGFGYELDPEVRLSLQQNHAAQWMDHQSALDRIVAIDKEMFARTGHHVFAHQKTAAQFLSIRQSALLADDMGVGKAAGVSEPVLSPTGWRTMGDLRVGDSVIGSDARPTKVLGVFPQGVRDLYKITLANETDTRCDLQHLWRVRLVDEGVGRSPLRGRPVGSRDRWAVVTLEEMISERSLKGLEIPSLKVLYSGSDGFYSAEGEIVTHSIRSIEPAGREECVCIRVAAEDHLYVTKDFILTHNTLSAILAIPANAPILVVGPAVTKGVWVGELKQWRPGIPSLMLSGRSSFVWPKSGQMVVTNYDILPEIHDKEGKWGRACEGFYPAKDCPGCRTSLDLNSDPPRVVVTGHLPACDVKKNKLPAKRCPGCHPILDQAPEHCVVIADEAHKLKNYKALRTLRFSAIAAAARRKNGRTWPITGTPLQNEPMELWTILQTADLAREAFGSFKTFVEVFKGKELPRGGYEWGLPDDTIKERMQRVSLRRLYDEVFPDAPKMRFRTIVVDVDPKALRACEAFLKAQGLTADEVATYVEKQLKDKEEVSFAAMSSVRAALASAKIPAMLEFIEEMEEAGEPLLVFSAHRAPIDTLESRKGWLVITGDVPPAKRKAIEEQFQDPKSKIRGIGLTIEAGGESLTLTRARYELFVDSSWKPTAMAQAARRAHRIGQQRGVIVTNLVARHPLDERVSEVLIEKSRLIAAAVDSSVASEDAPDKAFEEQMLRIRTEIAGGCAVRRPPGSEDEKAALKALRTATFRSAREERLASDLTEEAAFIHLTDAQWKLVCDLAREWAGRAEDGASRAREGAGGRERAREEGESESESEKERDRAPSAPATSLPRPPKVRKGWPSRDKS